MISGSNRWPSRRKSGCYKPTEPLNNQHISSLGNKTIVISRGEYRAQTDDPPDASRDAISQLNQPNNQYISSLGNETIIISRGEYRARTDDPLRARQVL